ncbi:MAG TPA: tRNA pseudouridine(38-40) synthase TruA [Fimbriiglobus sp.]
MRNIKLILRYDGTNFAGWQIQPNVRTVQEVLETAIRSVTREVRVYANASGRTDSGVHALGQVVNFFSASTIECAALMKAINANLPEDVAITSCVDVTQSFCANRDAVRKLYRYQIDDGRVPDPFLRKFAWQPRKRLDEGVMYRAARCLLGRHDFRSFETHWPNRLTSVRTITRLCVERIDGTVRVEVEADGFLYNMVRSIVGTLYHVGRGYWPEEKVRQVLEIMDRREAGPTAPPQGLFLVRVSY